MKKSPCGYLGFFIILGLFKISPILAQENSGIGTNTPTSKLHIKGTGNTSGTSSLHVMNSSDAPLLFVRDNGYVGIGTSNPLSALDVTGWQYLRDASFPMLMMSSSNVNATKDVGFHFDGNGVTPSNEVRFGRYAKSSGSWEANVIRLSIMAPESSLYLTSTGNFGIGLGSAIASHRLEVRGPVVNTLIGEHGQVASFQDNAGAAQTFFAVKAAGGAWNPLTTANDNGIFWKDDGTVESANGFVIAPWSASGKGIRIDGVTGNVGIGVNNSAYKLQAEGDIYANQGALMSSMNTAEGGRVAIYNHTKTGSAIRLFTQYNMTGAYGNKYSLWAYDANGLTQSERFSVWDNGDISFHNATGVSTVKFTNSGNVGIGLAGNVPTALLHLKNGHIRSEQTTAPTPTVTTQKGITSFTLASGSSDTKGVIQCTGDNDATGNSILFVDFNVDYTVAPVVVITAANLQGQAYTYFVQATTAGFSLNLRDAGTNANPYFNYIIIE